MTAATIEFDAADARVWDVVIVGAGPAGSLLALQLARRGRAVLLLDKSTFPRPKLCGCCISGAAAAALAAVGLEGLLQRLGAVELRTVQLAAGRNCAILPLGDGFKCVSRERLDAALAAQAAAAGAAFLQSTAAQPPQDALRPIGSTRRVEIRHGQRRRTLEARIVVAANGLAGGQFAADDLPLTQPDSRVGVGCIAEIAPAFYKPGTIFMACSTAGYAGMVRLEDGRLDIAAALDAGELRRRGTAAAVSRIIAQAGWPPLDMRPLRWRGMSALTRRRTRLGAERLFFVGDAAGYVEPFTGEGVAWAMHSALALAPIVDASISDWHADAIGAWTQRHRRLLGSRQRQCAQVARLLRSAPFTRLAVGVLARAPILGARFITRLNRAPS